MRRRSVIALSLLALLVFAGTAFGQAQRGTITVTVISEDGSRLPGATVTAESDQTLTRRTSVTDAQGVAELRALAPAENYVVTTQLDGFNTSKLQGVLIRAGQNTPLEVTLSLATVQEELIVTAEAPVVDTTSAITGEDITLQLTESLPTNRSYQDYLQLVPGVLPSPTGNPASRSGINYSDIGGDVGTSSDNFYYFEGINVTDGRSGLNGADLNTEIIQEQSVLTGGIPAEFAGAPGLISNVITKSGGNQFSGSLNYYFQDDGLVADNENEQEATFSTFDTAATLGGPIVRDKAWFFGSLRRVERDDDVITPDTDEFLRTVTSEADQAFAKITWAPTQSDLFSGVFLSDPTERSGSRNNENSNARDFARETGGERFSVNYSRVFTNLSFEVAATEHDGELSDISAIREPRNDLSFRPGTSPSQAEQQLGGFGLDEIDERGTEGIEGSAEYFLSTGWGDHTIKGGVELTEYNNFRNESFIGDPPALWTSLPTSEAGATMEEVRLFSRVDFDASIQDDFTGLLEAIERSPNTAQLRALLDGNGDGTITQQEVLENLRFNSTDGNPDGLINYVRNLQVASGSQDTRSEGTVFYVQDNWQWKKWSINAGIRAEEWEHFATTGEDIFTFDTEYAPRLSVAYDIFGNGKHRLSGYFGRYHDPIRNNMTNFAGTLTGQRTEEQVYVGGEWLTFRFRGGSTQRDAIFVPTTKTPFTDEIMIGYKTDLGRNMSLEANLIDRETDDILEDYFLQLYADPGTYPGPQNNPNSLFLGLPFFGLNGFPPNINFFIGTLPEGSFRDWQGLELIFRKRFSNNWQLLASYNYADAEGNTNSDSNADFQGDVLFLDPRAPNVLGPQPGSIEHLLKISGSYNWDNGLQLGANYRWNSGTLANRTFRIFGRNLPLTVDRIPGPPDDFEFAGFNNGWVAPGQVGTLENPDFGIFDLRLAYVWDISGRIQADFFVDVFNVFDEQEAIRIQDIVSGLEGVQFGDGLTFNDPRRFFLGARLRF